MPAPRAGAERLDAGLSRRQLALEVHGVTSDSCIGGVDANNVALSLWLQTQTTCADPQPRPGGRAPWSSSDRRLWGAGTGLADLVAPQTTPHAPQLPHRFAD